MYLSWEGSLISCDLFASRWLNILQGPQAEDVGARKAEGSIFAFYADRRWPMKILHMSEETFACPKRAFDRGSGIHTYSEYIMLHINYPLDHDGQFVRG